MTRCWYRIIVDFAESTSQVPPSNATTTSIVIHQLTFITDFNDLYNT